MKKKWHVLLIFVFSSLAPFGLQGCFGVQTPQVTDPNRVLASFTHYGNEKSCNVCHDQNRPPDIQLNDLNATPIVHGNGADCINCHSSGQAWIYPTVYSHNPVPVSCMNCHEAERKSSTHFPSQDCSGCHQNNLGVSWTGGNFSHSPVPASCSLCHAPQRPTTAAHASGADCSDCHSPTQAWINPSVYSHSPVPTGCLSCHETSRPAVTRMPLNSTATGHFSPTDCASCHQVPASTGEIFTFQHNDSSGKTLGTCLPCHEAERKSSTHYTGQDCSACHTDPGKTWLASTLSPHPTNIPMPVSCNGCHESSRPSTTQYPPPGALVTGHFAGQDCIGCHSAKTTADLTFAHKHGANNIPLITCLPCHQAKRPTAVIHSFSHSLAGTGDCVACHKKPGVTWTDGVFSHSPVPTGCNTCHLSEKPTVLIGEMSHQYPGVADCTGCHKTNIGISWTGGTFAHSPAPTSCSLCHSPQRPTTVINNYDHALDLTKDCAICHKVNIGTSWTGGKIDHALLTTASVCTTCHLSGTSFLNVNNSPVKTLATAAGSLAATSTTAAHKMIHNGINFSSIDCDSCHAVKTGWGTSWATSTTDPMGGPNHNLIPATTTCKTCHGAPTGSFAITGARAGSSFKHSSQGKHSSYDCNRCHTSANYTWKFATPSANCSLCH